MHANSRSYYVKWWPKRLTSLISAFYISVCKSFSFGSDFSAAVNRFAGLFGEVLTARRRRLSLLEQPFSFAIPINTLIPALDQLLTGVILGKMKFSKIAFSKNKFMVGAAIDIIIFAERGDIVSHWCFLTDPSHGLYSETTLRAWVHSLPANRRLGLSL